MGVLILKYQVGLDLLLFQLLSIILFSLAEMYQLLGMLCLGTNAKQSTRVPKIHCCQHIHSAFHINVLGGHHPSEHHSRVCETVLNQRTALNFSK